MVGNINIKGLFKEVGSSRYRGSTSSEDFRHKAKAVLVSAGFEKTRAGKLATGIRSGSLKLSGKEAVKMVRALKEGKMIRSSVSDVSSAVNRFARSADKGPDAARAEEEKEVIREKRMATLARLRAAEDLDPARQWLETREQAKAQVQPAQPVQMAQPAEEPEESAPEPPADLPVD